MQTIQVGLIARLRGALIMISATVAGGSALQQPVMVTFTNIAAQAGINFKHQNGASPQKFMPETMGAGAVFFDYDSDGWPDIFMVNSGSFVDARAASAARHAL